MVKRIAMQAASQGDKLDSRDLRGITVEEFEAIFKEFEAFKQEAWVAIRAERRYDEVSLRFPDFIFPFFEGRAYSFLIDRLPKQQSLAQAYAEFQRRQRQWPWVRVALLGSILPATAALGSGLYLGGAPLVIGIFIYMAAGMGALSINAALLTPRFVTALLLLAATAWLGLAKAGVKAMGNKKDARPLHWAAMVAFIIGSLLDLLGGWYQYQ